MKQAIIMITLILLLAGCNLGTSDVTAVPTPDLPSVEILSPANNQQVIIGVDFNFDIVARDSTAGIALVELYVDDALINFSTPVDAASVPIFRTEMNWQASGIGRHIIAVIAYREDGTPSDPARLTIEVLEREG
ncbi:MAG: Ig-like domain-containing protein [Phototrophicaceae bacterium]